MMGCRDSCGLCKITRVRIPQFRVSLEFIEFLEFSGVVGGRDISPGLSLVKSRSNRLVYRSSSPFSALTAYRGGTFVLSLFYPFYRLQQ